MENIKILIVDDFSVIRDTLPKILEKFGFQAVAVSSAYEALAYLQEHAVELIMTDISMPGMSGLDLLDAIKEKYDDLPVLVMSGNMSKYEGARLDRAEARLAKPFMIDDMMKKISFCLGDGIDP